VTISSAGQPQRVLRQRLFPRYNDGKFTWNADPKFYEDLYHGNFTQYADPTTGELNPRRAVQTSKRDAGVQRMVEGPGRPAAIAEHCKSEDLGHDDASLPGG